MAARPSEIRAFLLRFAARKGLLVKEYVSDWRDGPIGFYCHVQSNSPIHSATAISLEGHDNALVMAFLSFYNSELNFLTEEAENHT